MIYWVYQRQDQNNEDQCKENMWQDQVANLKSMIKIKSYEDLLDSSKLAIKWMIHALLLVQKWTLKQSKHDLIARELYVGHQYQIIERVNRG